MTVKVYLRAFGFGSLGYELQYCIVVYIWAGTHLLVNCTEINTSHICKILVKRVRKIAKSEY